MYTKDMVLNVLDYKEDKWYLAKMKLWNYLEGLDADNFSFEIQRGIVQNDFLDSISETILKNEPIPPITLNATKHEITDDKLNIDNFVILDGLQRSYRLWLYKTIIDMCNSGISFLGIVDNINNQPFYKRGFFTVKHIRGIITKHEDLEKSLKDFDVYFYVWLGLGQKDLIRMMLTLNAGAKSVSKTHQYELLFLNIYNTGKDLSHLSMIRSKDQTYSNVKNGDRQPGTLLFASVMVGYQSLLQGKPLRIDTKDFDLEDYSNDNLFTCSRVEKFFEKGVISEYLEFLYETDLRLCNGPCSSEYLKWFVKDTTIAGIMGAIGIDYNMSDIPLRECLNNYTLKLRGLGDDPYRLQTFEQMYQQLPSTRINIGKVIRNAIFHATVMLLYNGELDWESAFNKSLYK